MGRLYKVVMLAFLLSIVGTGSRLPAQEYCSLRVRVLTPDGHRPAVSVYVEEKGGRQEEGEQDRGDVSFCDLGGLPVTVRVGEEGSCNQATIRNVPVAWDEPYTLTVIYDPTPCLRDLPRAPVPTCRTVFRVADSDGKWVRGATINLTQPTAARIRTDRFGRASFVTKLGDCLQGAIDSPGQAPRFQFTCTRDEPVHEQLLVIRSR